MTGRIDSIPGGGGGGRKPVVHAVNLQLFRGELFQKSVKSMVASELALDSSDGGDDRIFLRAGRAEIVSGKYAAARKPKIKPAKNQCGCKAPKY